jgi:ribosomal protein S27AE
VATTSQRVYRAACPNCGAPVEFASAASASAVCSFCRSTLVRDGDALRRVGVSAELFDDHSPLQLGASGTRQGLGFTLVGRLQYSSAGGTWNEWHALFESIETGGEGRAAWLSEDNGAYVLAFDAPLPGDAPDIGSLRAGQRVVVDGRGWDVASVVRAKLLAAEGELPRPPATDREFTVVDLRNAQGEVGTLDGSDPARLGWSIGRSVTLAELRMQGLKEGESEKTLKGRSFECPNCGAAMEVTLASTKSLTCGQCTSVVDVSQGVGGDLAHYQQNNSGVGGQEPQLPLGRSGTLALGGPPAPWQVVGYQERCDIPDDAEDDTTFWREYLLYHRTSGFAFLVDANDGWSWVRPITGAPSVKGDAAQWQGVAYTKQFTYAAKVTWVLGEFYWPVRQGERALVTDYVGRGGASTKRLSREQTGNEVTWSAGEAISAATVADAFAISPKTRPALARDVTASAIGSGAMGGIAKALIILAVIVVLMSVLSTCSKDDCDEVRQTFGDTSNEYQQCQRSRATGGNGGVRINGGSYGGWSSGSGGHK